MNDTHTTAGIAPVRKTLHLPAPIDEVFERFTGRMAEWWPLATHSVAKENAASVAIEGRVGGRVFERTTDGAEHLWGTVLEWSPPQSFAMTWHPDRTPDVAQRVEVRFRTVDAGTELELIHSGWETMGDRAQEVRDRYDGGWMGVLAKLEATFAAD